MGKASKFLAGIFETIGSASQRALTKDFVEFVRQLGITGSITAAAAAAGLAGPALVGVLGIVALLGGSTFVKRLINPGTAKELAEKIAREAMDATDLRSTVESIRRAIEDEGVRVSTLDQLEIAAFVNAAGGQGPAALSDALATRVLETFAHAGFATEATQDQIIKKLSQAALDRAMMWEEQRHQAGTLAGMEVLLVGVAAKVDQVDEKVTTANAMVSKLLDLAQRNDADRLRELRPLIEADFAARLQQAGGARGDPATAARELVDQVLARLQDPQFVERTRQVGGADAVLEAFQSDQTKLARAAEANIEGLVAAAWKTVEWALLLGRSETARESLDNILRFRPTSVWAVIFRGHVHCTHGELERAAQLLTAAQKLPNIDERTRSVLYNEIGNVLLAQGDGPAALTAYRAS